MRTLLAVMFVSLPLIQAQDSAVVKSVEPNYEKYNSELATDFNTATARVTVTVLSNGKPLSLDWSSVPLPMSVVMALKDYEFRPLDTVPHGSAGIDGLRFQSR